MASLRVPCCLAVLLALAACAAGKPHLFYNHAIFLYCFVCLGGRWMLNEHDGSRLRLLDARVCNSKLNCQILNPGDAHHWVKKHLIKY